MHTSPLHMKVGTAFACTAFVDAVTTTVSSHVPLHYHIQKTQFPCSYPPPLDLKTFLSPLPSRSLSLGRMGSDIYVPFMLDHSAV